MRNSFPSIVACLVYLQRPVYALVFLMVLLFRPPVYSQGQLWGLTPSGGSNNTGAIFKTNGDGTSLQVAHHFPELTPGRYPNPVGMFESTDGKLFGISNEGSGMLYRFFPETNTTQKIYDFGGKDIPTKFVRATDGKFYLISYNGGTNLSGSLSQFDPATGVYTKRHDFNSNTGGFPSGIIDLKNGTLLISAASGGGTSAQGGLYQYTLATGTIQWNLSFPKTTFPNSGTETLFIMENGRIFGCTGRNVFGSTPKSFIYEYLPVSNTYTIRKELVSTEFVNIIGMSFELNGKIYGISSVPVRYFLTEYDPAANTFVNKRNFVGLTTVMLASNGLVYGVDQGVGPAIFEYDIASGTYSNKLTPFNSTNGSDPRIPMKQSSTGMLYSMTQLGGSANEGVIYRYDITNNTYAKLLDFGNSPGGGNPEWGLTRFPNGKFYGVTTYRGTHDTGVIFEYDPATSTFTKKVDFDGINGEYPTGKLALANGKFYGTAYGRGDGTLFEYDPSTNVLTKKYSFIYEMGGYPEGSLAVAPNGKLYGVTNQGGTMDIGVLYEYDPIANTYATRHEFAYETGVGFTPGVGLTLAANGKFYGMTQQGGIAGLGTIFEFDPATYTYTKKHDFTSTIGTPRYPSGMFTEANNGRLYALVADANSVAHIIEFDPATSVYVKKADLASINGRSPAGSLSASANGKLYGMTELGGTHNLGILFEYDPVTNTVVKKADFTGSLNGAKPKYGALLFDKGSQQITFDSLSNAEPGDTLLLTATSSSGLQVTYTSSNTSVARVEGSNLIVLAHGTSIITASQTGNAYYYAAQDVQQTLIVQSTKADQVITFNPLPLMSPDDTTFVLSATASSGLPVSYSSSDTSVAIVEGNTMTITGIGTTIITAYQPGNDSYNAAPNVDQPLHVKYFQSATVAPIPVKKVGDAPFTAPVTISSGLPATYTSSKPNVASVNGSTITIHAVGSTTITGVQSGNDSYHPLTFEFNIIVELGAPTTASSQPVFSKVTNESMTFSFTRGNGQKCLVVLRPNTAVNFTPVKDVAYPVGTVVNTDNTIVMNGTGDRVELTGLSANVLYYLKVYEYNQAGDTILYLTTRTLSASSRTSALTYVTTPADGALNQNVTLAISAFSVTGATSYVIELTPQPISQALQL